MEDNTFLLIHENTQHLEMMGELKNEEYQEWENMRHTRAVESINNRNDNKSLEKDDWELVKD